MVLPGSGILNVLLHIPGEANIVDASNYPTTLARGMLIGVRSDQSEVTVHLDQAATITHRETKEEDMSVEDTTAIPIVQENNQKKTR